MSIISAQYTVIEKRFFVLMYGSSEGGFKVPTEVSEPGFNLICVDYGNNIVLPLLVFNGVPINKYIGNAIKGIELSYEKEKASIDAYMTGTLIYEMSRIPILKVYSYEDIFVNNFTSLDNINHVLLHVEGQFYSSVTPDSELPDKKPLDIPEKPEITSVPEITPNPVTVSEAKEEVLKKTQEAPESQTEESKEKKTGSEDIKAISFSGEQKEEEKVTKEIEVVKETKETTNESQAFEFKINLIPSPRPELVGKSEEELDGMISDVTSDEPMNNQFKNLVMSHFKRHSISEKTVKSFIKTCSTSQVFDMLHLNIELSPTGLYNGLYFYLYMYRVLLIKDNKNMTDREIDIALVMKYVDTVFGVIEMEDIVEDYESETASLEFKPSLRRDLNWSIRKFMKKELTSLSNGKCKDELVMNYICGCGQRGEPILLSNFVRDIGLEQLEVLPDDNSVVFNYLGTELNNFVVSNLINSYNETKEYVKEKICDFCLQEWNNCSIDEKNKIIMSIKESGKSLYNLLSDKDKEECTEENVDTYIASFSGETIYNLLPSTESRLIEIKRINMASYDELKESSYNKSLMDLKKVAEFSKELASVNAISKLSDLELKPYKLVLGNIDGKGKPVGVIFQNVKSKNITDKLIFIPFVGMNFMQVIQNHNINLGFENKSISSDIVSTQKNGLTIYTFKDLVPMYKSLEKEVVGIVLEKSGCVTMNEILGKIKQKAGCSSTNITSWVKADIDNINKALKEVF